MQQRQPVPPQKPLPSGARRPPGNVGAKGGQSLGGTCASSGSLTTAAGATGDAETWAQGGFGTSSGSTAGCSAPSSLGLDSTRTRIADGLDGQADDVQKRVAHLLLGALDSGALRRAVEAVTEEKLVGSSLEGVRKRVATSLVVAASSGKLHSAVMEVVAEKDAVADLRQRVSDTLVSAAGTGELRQKIAEVSHGSGSCGMDESAKFSGIPRELLFGSGKHLQKRAAETLAAGFESGGLGRAQLRKRAADTLLGAFQSGALRGALVEVTGAKGGGGSSSSYDLSQLRRRVAGALTTAAESGELRRKVAEVTAASIPAQLLFGSDKQVQTRAAGLLADGVLSGEVREAQLQKRAADVLSAGFASGKLQASTRSADTEELPGHLLFGSDKHVQKRAAETLAGAFESGGLHQAVLRTRVASTLTTAVESGKIAAMKGSGQASSSSDPFPRRVESSDTFHGIPRELLFGSDKHVQQRAVETLTSAIKSGQLGQALLQKRAADTIIAGFRSGKLKTGLAADAGERASESELPHDIPRRLLFGSDKHVRKRAADLLDVGLQSGRLEDAVSASTCARVAKLLLDSHASGTLDRAVASMSSSTHLRGRMAALLDDAVESHKLEEVLRTVSPKHPSTQRSGQPAPAQTLEPMPYPFPRFPEEGAAAWPVGRASPVGAAPVAQQSSDAPVGAGSAAPSHTAIGQPTSAGRVVAGAERQEQAHIAAVGQSVQEGLVNAQRSGHLEDLVEGTLGRTDAALPARSGGARRSSAPELDAARSTAAGAMVRAFNNGELGNILQCMKADMTPQEMRAMERMRRRSMNRLGNASDLGQLRKAMLSVKQEREACVDAAAKLQGAVESGALREALQAARQQRLAKLQSASENGALREALQAAKEQRMAGPPGAGMLAGQPLGAAQQLAAKQLEEARLQQPAQEASKNLLEAISVRGRRLGELRAAVEITKMLISQRVERCRQVENQVATTKANLAHLELDIEWHRHALEQAADRSFDLEAACRKARSQLTPRLPATRETTSAGQLDGASK